MIKRMIPLTLAAFCLEHEVCWSQSLIDPPLALNLGSNHDDGSVSIACAGSKPYSKLSCKVYHLSVTRPSIEEYRKSRAALEKDLANTSEADLMKKLRDTCSDLASAESDLLKNVPIYSPGRAASARDGIGHMRALCRCQMKQCVTSVMLEEQTHEQEECTIGSSVFSPDFVKVSDHKWVSNNGPEGICGVVSVLTIEHEATDATLWTYTEQYSYTKNNADRVCKLAHNTTSTFSWKSGKTVRLKCDELKFDISPEVQ